MLLPMLMPVLKVDHILTVSARCHRVSSRRQFASSRGRGAGAHVADLAAELRSRLLLRGAYDTSLKDNFSKPQPVPSGQALPATTGSPAARHSGRPSSKRRMLNPRSRKSATASNENTQ